MPHYLQLPLNHEQECQRLAGILYPSVSGRIKRLFSPSLRKRVAILKAALYPRSYIEKMFKKS